MALSSCLLQLPRTRHTVTDVGQGLQPGPGDEGAALLAAAERPLVEAVQGLVDLFERLLLVLQEAQRELVFIIIAALVRAVGPSRAAGKIAAPCPQGLVGQVGDVPRETALE